MPATRPSSHRLLRLLEEWGALWNRLFALVGGVSYLMLDVAVWLFHGAFTRRVRLGRTAVVTQMLRIGVRSIGIVVLVCASIGFILALQMAPALADSSRASTYTGINFSSTLSSASPLDAARSSPASAAR